jgi:ATP-dependent RNA helicase SUPV3L1/SUV3
VLLRSLGEREDLLAGVAEGGEVTVEGHFVGRLLGLAFEADRAASTLEEKALRAAAHRAVGPEVARRLGRIAGDPDSAFALSPDGLVLWRGEAVGALTPSHPFRPRILLFGDLGPAPARDRAQARLEAFVAAEAGRRLAPLRRLEAAMADGKLKGLARGIAWRLSENGGIIDRASAAADIASLSHAERRTLKSYGVRFGAFSVFLPALLEPRAATVTAALAAVGAPGWALSGRGLRDVAGRTYAVLTLERLDETLRTADFVLTDVGLEALGWQRPEAEQVLKALGFFQARKARDAEPAKWRRRAHPKLPPTARPAPSSPFSALADLPPTRARPAAHRRRKPRRAESAKA